MLHTSPMETQRRASFEQHSQDVLNLLGAGHQLTRAEIASRLGVTRTTITPVLSQLHDEGAIVTVATQSGEGRGRRAAILAIDPTAVRHIGVDMSHTRVIVILANNAGTEIVSGMKEFQAGATWESRCTTAIKFIQTLVSSHELHLRQLSRIAIGLPGSASWHFGFSEENYPAVFPSRAELKAESRTQVMQDSANDTRLRVTQIFAEEFHVPVATAHHIRYAAIAEAANHPSAENLLYVRLSSGVGGAVIDCGKAVVGAAKLAGEIGHMCVDHSDNAPLCRCGKRGCLEAFISITALENSWRKAGHPKDTFADLCEAAHQDNPERRTNPGNSSRTSRLPDSNRRAQEIVVQAAKTLGRAIGCAAVVTDPDSIVISGEVGNLLLTQQEVIQTEVDKEILPVAQSRVCAASVGFKAGAVGAVIASMSEANTASTPSTPPNLINPRIYDT